MMKCMPTKMRGWALNPVCDLPRSWLRSTAGKQECTLTETMYQFDIRLFDTPLFCEQSYNLFVRKNARSRTECVETSDTVDQRTQQQYSRRQAIDTSRSVATSLMDEFRQPGKSSEGFEVVRIESCCGVSR